MLNKLISIMTRLNRKQTAQRRGAATVEFAMIAPLMLTFTFGLVEVGRLSMVKNQAVQATREGARLAVVPNATALQVNNRVQESLAIMGIDDAAIEIIPASLSTAAPGSFVTVRVTIDPHLESWVPGFLAPYIPDVVAETVMRREATN